MKGLMPVSGLPEIFPPSERTLPKMLTRQAKHHGGRRLVTVRGRSLTFAGTEAAAAGYAGTLAAAGVSTGDRVAIMCGNRLELLLTVLGCGWLGAIAVPINTASRGAQLDHILANCGARLLVVERELVPVVARPHHGTIALEALWFGGEGEEGKGEPHPFSASPFPQPRDGVPPHPVQPSDTFAILYT